MERIVIKVGSNTITDNRKYQINFYLNWSA